MRETVDFTSWIAGWTALAFVVAYGIFLIRRSSRLKKALDAVPSRILVTGSRGKSGTVRLIHEILRRSGQSAYGKVTGTIAVELYPDGSEHETVRLGATPSISGVYVRGDVEIPCGRGVGDARVLDTTIPFPGSRPHREAPPGECRLSIDEEESQRP